MGGQHDRCGSLQMKDEPRRPFEIVARACSLEDVSQISPVAFVLGAPSSSVERKLIPATSVLPGVTHEKNDFLHQAQSKLA